MTIVYRAPGGNPVVELETGRTEEVGGFFDLLVSKPIQRGPAPDRYVVRQDDPPPFGRSVYAYFDTEAEAIAFADWKAGARADWRLP